METNFKTLLKFAITGLFLYLGVGNVFAAKLYITPATASLGVGTSGTATVYIDTEGKKVFGTDMYINVTGSAVKFTSVNAAGNIGADEVDKTIGTSQLVIRVSSFDEDIQGTQALVTIGYQGLAVGTTTLSFKTGGNFDTTLVAESDTADDILTTTQGITFNVSNTGTVVTATCGNGVVEGTEQCEPASNTCASGYTCSATCLCTYTGSGSTGTITPIITGVTTPIITTDPNNNGGGITPIATLPGTALDSNQLRVVIVSGGLATIGLALLALFSLPEFNLELLGNKLKIKFAMNNKAKIENEKAKFENEMID